MAEFEQIQKDFSGGEISGKLFMRDDMDLHHKSVNVMLNFIPTLQGTAVRTPGTRFFTDVPEGDCRIIPFLPQNNVPSLIVITPATAAGADDGSMEILSGLTDVLGNSTMMAAGSSITPHVPQEAWTNISINPGFREGLKYWWAQPPEYPGNDGASLGCWLVNNAVVMVAADRGHAKEEETVFLVKELTVPEDCTDFQFTAGYRYVENFSGIDAKYSGALSFGTTPFTRDVFERTFDQDSFGVGSPATTPVYSDKMADGVTDVAFTAGQKLYMTFEITAIKEDGQASVPSFNFFSLTFQTKVLREITSEIIGTIPYTADEIGDIHYIQNPYIRGDGSGGKDMVLVHPNHVPSWIKFTGSAYVFQPIPFGYEPEGGGAVVAWYPPSWDSGGFPGACTSFNGRLILAGASAYPDLGSVTGAGTETVWGTEVGEWNLFTDPAGTEVNPDDSIEFTAIYRSPIQWVAGQKELLIGARDMEYTASADSIFQPADIGVSMQSTHGSANVQPVGLGETILFPAEGGTRVRAMNFRQDDDGYVSPDLTFMNPTLCYSGIKRMVRMRNPHQIVVCLLGDGRLAMLSYDPHVGVVGWSRIQLDGPIFDVCVLADEDGVDILFVTVERYIDGVRKLYIEAFRDWREGEYGEYLQCGSKFVVPNTNVIGGLDHLEGAWVQVVGDNNYLGGYKVVGGQVTLVNELGHPLNVSEALVGFSMTATLRTLPLVTQDPGGKKRYTSISVRGVFSTLAEINHERPKTRTPATLMGNSEPIDWFSDYKVANLGSDKYQSVLIVEYVPFRTEVIGIFGKVKVSSV